MVAKKNRMDVSEKRVPLTDSPFAALDALKGDFPITGSPETAPKAEILKTVSPPYRVARTRKGGWPLSFEKRAAGKLVTILRNVSGDGKALLKALRKHCATGGVLREDAIELQGDHRDKVTSFLETHCASPK